MPGHRPLPPDARLADARLADAAPPWSGASRELAPATRLALAANACVLSRGKAEDRAALADRLAALDGVDLTHARPAELLRDVARLYLDHEATLELLATALLEHTRAALAQAGAMPPRGTSGNRRLDPATHAARTALAQEILEE